jgi:acetyl-CoA carboxylase carboxyltransferase component
MGAESAVNVLYRKELEAAEDKEQFRREKIEEYRDTFSTPYWSAGVQVIDVIIRPAETRHHLITALDMLKNKVEERAPRKHGNIPL